MAHVSHAMSAVMMMVVVVNSSGKHPFSHTQAESSMPTHTMVSTAFAMSAMAHHSWVPGFFIHWSCGNVAVRSNI